MDTKETLSRKQSAQNKWQQAISKTPIVGLVMMLIASAVCYLSFSHDQKVWEQLFSYHSGHLLQIEKPLYQDFYQKRLSIEKIGSKEELTTIQQAIQPDDNQLLTTIILSDRSFRIFLEQKAPIYFSPKQRAYWQTHNEVIKEKLAQLSIYQLGIISERFKQSPQIMNLFSYIFVDVQVINFLSNIILLLILCSIIERHIRRFFLLGFIVSFSCIYACLYLAITHSFSKPLFGLNALIYILIALVVSVFTQQHYRTRFAQYKYLLFIGLGLLSLKLGHDIFYQVFSKESATILLLLCVMSLFMAQSIYGYTQRALMTEGEHKSLPLLSETSRALYAEALNALSRFNFKYARNKLRHLIELEPSSKQILESSYHLEKLTPEDEIFGRLAQNRIDEALKNQDYPAMRLIFEDIQHSAPNRQSAKRHIAADYYLKMLVLFLQNNDTEKAEHAFMFLELAGQKTLVQDACKLLIESFSKKQRLKKKAHYQALYQSYLIDS